MTYVLRCRADFAVRTDAEGKEVLETSKSTGTGEVSNGLMIKR